MKYTARHIQRFLEQGLIDPVQWRSHFPALLPTRLPSCEDCEDFKSRICAGHRDPVECFLSGRTGTGDDDEGTGDRAKRKKKTRDPLLGAGTRKNKIPAGANKAYDQSKM